MHLTNREIDILYIALVLFHDTARVCPGLFIQPNEVTELTEKFVKEVEIETN